MTDNLRGSAEVVRLYLEASMVPDPEAASSYIAAEFKVTFTGGRVYDSPFGPTQFNASRYKWVKKRMLRFDVAPGTDEDVVYSIGYLYGEWLDGRAFDRNRYVDRFVVRDGKIVKMDVWNDSAEWILEPKCQSEAQASAST